MTSAPRANLHSPIGGASGDAGIEYQRAVAAFFAAHGLNGVAVTGVRVPSSAAVVESVALETDEVVDDVAVTLKSPYRLLIQAKRTLRKGSVFDKVARQWLHAVRDDRYDAEYTRLVVCSRSMPWWGEAAGAVFDRERHGRGGGRTAREQQAVAIVEDALREAEPHELEAAKASAVFLPLALDEGADSSDRARLLLDGRVVVAGEGLAAWRHLVRIAGIFARGRSGGAMEDWLQHLRDSEMTLVQDEEASAAARLERRHQAVTAYRKMLCDRGASLDLRSLGADIPPIPFDELDADVKVKVPESDDRDRGRELLWAFRRRGRVLLTGLPGGGKTTALRRIAGQWAGYRRWALPVCASLKRISEISPPAAFREAISAVATETLSGEDGRFVREAIDEGLSRGTVALFLDGLDESGSRRHELVRALDDLLAACHADVDIILATRDVAYSQGATLGFADLRLQRPDDLSDTIRRVLVAAAEARRVAGDEVEGWIAERADWVEAVVSSNPPLGETPLMPVLLTLLASESHIDDLPARRVLILSRVIRDVVHRSERQRPHFRIGSLSAEETASALVATFPLIAREIAAAGGSSPREPLEGALRRVLVEDWRLPSAGSEAAAARILAFWDDASIFVGRGERNTVSPGTQLFLEVGEALYAAHLVDAEARAWTRNAAADEFRHETLVLAASLSRTVADQLFIETAAAPTHALLNAAVDAALDGAEGDVARLVPPALDRISVGDKDAWYLAEKVLKLPLPDIFEPALAEAFTSAFAGGRQRVGRALVVLKYGRRSSEALQWLGEVLDVRDLEPLPGGSGALPGLQLRISSDRAVSKAIVGATDILLDEGWPILESVESAATGLSSAGLNEMVAVLERHGHAELGARLVQQSEEAARPAVHRLSRMFDHDRLSVEEALSTVVSLDRPATLSPAEARRLDELADFCETLNLNWMSAWQLSADRFATMVELVATLGGFKRDVVAAQAQVVLDLVKHWGHHGPFFGLFDLARSRGLSRWADVGDQDAAVQFFVSLLGSGWYNTHLSVIALIDLPSPQDARGRVLECLPRIGVRERHLAALAALVMSADQRQLALKWASDADPVLRRVAAEEYQVLLDQHGVGPLCLLIRDDDGGVREQALRFVEKHHLLADGHVRETVEHAGRSDPPGWMCTSCGAANAPMSGGCTKCSVIAPNPRAAAASLLGSSS